MVLHDQVDWRNLEDSLALDVRLVESVFYGLSNAYNKRQHDRELRPTHNQLDEKLFAKADVLVALENAEGYLKKRPWLRVLHTRLACVSSEKEERAYKTLYAIVNETALRRLEAIYADAKLSMEVEDKHKKFLAQARAVSPWCLYGVHVLPPRHVTEEELQAQRDCVASHARAVVSAAVGLVMDKMLAPIKRDPRQLRDALRQAKAKREQAERVTQLRALRLELLAPTADLTNNEAEASKKKSKDGIARVVMQLAAVEAQGDARLARKLLDHTIVQSGLRRAAEQAKRLGIMNEPWEVVKLWRELYRTSTLQALETALDG
ncbi:hypothetical protein GQ600_12951 [Phytophthora cactorum]|nr:hypothetical protein GQ600_12951 [Phytophthora cactorum]